jgi:succinoglycan biosynthesis transport protein ExoP
VDSLPNNSGVQPPAFIIANPEDDNSFDFWGVLSRRKWLVFLGLVTGMALGGLYHAQCETIYESQARVKIEPRNPAAFRMTNTELMNPNMEMFTSRHDRLMGQYNIVQRCLTVKDLMGLDSFNDIPEEQVVELVMDNLEITPDKEEPILYELVYRCNDQDDARTVLNNLIATYNEVLDEQYRNESSEYVEVLKQVRREFNDSYKELAAKLEDTQKQHDAPIIMAGDLNVHQVAIRDLGVRIQDAQERLAELLTDQERANEALSAGPAEIENLVWILYNEGKVKDSGRREEQDARAKAQIEKDIQMLEVALRELSFRYGPSHPEVRALRQQRDFWLDYMNNDEVDLLGLDPELILRRYLLSVSQGIKDQRSSISQASSVYSMHEQEAQRLANVREQMSTIRRQMDDVRDFMRMAEQKIVEIDPTGDWTCKTATVSDSIRFRAHPTERRSGPYSRSFWQSVVYWVYCAVSASAAWSSWRIKPSTILMKS